MSLETSGRRRSLIALGLWLCLVVAMSFLACLPWLWWNGGTVELAMSPSRIKVVGGNSYGVRLWPMIRKDSIWDWFEVEEDVLPAWFFEVMADSEGKPFSTLELYENGMALGPAHADSATVWREGGGSYCHQPEVLVFSTSDNSNPRTNGREYTIRSFSQPRIEPGPVVVLLAFWLGVAVPVTWAAARWRRVVAFLASSCAAGASPLATGLLLAVFSFYVLAFASLYRRPALVCMVFLGISGVIFLLLERRRLVFRWWMVWPAAFVVYVAVGALARDAASWLAIRDLLLSGAVGIVVASAMWRGFAGHGGRAARFLGVFYAGFVVVMLWQNAGFDVKSVLAGVDGLRELPWRFSTWNQKYQETWLLMLMWAVVAAVPFRRAKERLGVGAVLLLGALGAFSGYSYSARVVLGIGVVVFLCALVTPRIVRYGVTVVGVGLFLFLPLVMGLVWGWFSENHYLADADQGMGRHLVRRLVIWEYARELIDEHPWLGVGLGAAKGLPGSQGTAGELLANGSELPDHLAELRPLPGGHPHSLFLLVWLETGAVGAVLAAGFLVSLLRGLRRVRGTVRHGALLAFACTSLLVFGLNYPAWDPALLLLMVMASGLLASVVVTEEGDREGGEVRSA